MVDREPIGNAMNVLRMCFHSLDPKSLIGM